MEESNTFYKTSSNANLEELVYGRLDGVSGICRFLGREEDQIVLQRYPTNLYDYITRGGDFQDKWIEQLIDAITGMHNLNVIHGDINPRNILLDEQQNAFIADMDSCVVDSDLRAHEITRKIGTERWMSPHYIMTSIPERCDDFYSLGYVLWFCFTREKPFSKIDFEDVEDHILKGERESLREIPDRYRGVIEKLWNTSDVSPGRPT